MQEPFLTSLEITNSKTALFLADASKVRYIRPFFAKECSLGEAAKKLELPLANVRYWTEKMVELGLIKQTRTLKRKGSPIKYYRTVADEFMVPLEYIPITSVEELLELRDKPFSKRTNKALVKTAFKYVEVWQTRYYLQGDVLFYNIEPKNGDLEDAQIFYLKMLFRLTPEQAKVFRAELRELQARYMKLSVENLEDVPRHICHLLLVEES
jgi:hypothetical protein